MKQKENQRILGKHVRVLNDSRKTNLNNNDLVVGVSGSGKTGGYVIPNLRCCQESIYVADTKGLLYKQYAKDLEQVGYKVYLIDFVHPEYSRGYNPLDYIRPGRLPDSCREQDILTIAASMIPVRIYSEPFWEESAQVVLASLIAFAKEALPYEEQNLISVCKLNRVLGTPEGERIFAELEAEFPESFAVKKYKEYRNVFNAEKTWTCISQVVNRALGAYDIYEVKEMFRNRDGFHIADTGREKSAVFVHISDTDRSFDGLINVFYTQVFQELCADADKMPDGRLKIPVRIIFALTAGLGASIAFCSGTSITFKSLSSKDATNSLTAVSAFKRLLPVLMISSSNTDNSLILLMLSFSFHILIFKVRCQSLCHHTYCDEDVT